jgi:hypothetical protein
VGWRDGRRGAGASGAIRHKPSWLSLAAAGGGEVGRFRFAKLGWSRDLIALGPTSFSLDHRRSRPEGRAGPEGRAWGIAAAQAVEAHDAQLWLLVRRCEARGRREALRPGLSVFAGARIAF